MGREAPDTLSVLRRTVKWCVDNIRAVSSSLTAHVAAADPHTQYQKESEKGAVSGYAPLDAGSKVPTVNLGGAGADATKFLRGDQTWQVPGGGGTMDHAALTSNLNAGTSGHILAAGVAGRLWGFDAAGAYTSYVIGTDVQAYDLDLTTLATGGTGYQVPRMNAAGTAIEWVDPQAVAGADLVLFLDPDASDIATYLILEDAPSDDVETDTSAVANSGTGEVLILATVTHPGFPNLALWTGGVWHLSLWCYVDSAVGVSEVVVRLYSRTTGGVETEIADGTTGEVNALAAAQYDFEIAFPDTATAQSDRIVLKCFAKTTSVVNRTVHVVYAGASKYSHAHTSMAVPLELGSIGGTHPWTGKHTGTAGSGTLVAGIDNTGAAVELAFGTGAGNVCEGNDVRLPPAPSGPGAIIRVDLAGAYVLDQDATLPPTTGWTDDLIGTATTETDTHGACIVYGPTSTTRNLRVRRRALGASTTVSMRIAASVRYYSGGTYGAVVGFRDSSSGKCVVLSATWTSSTALSLQEQYWNSVTSFNSAVATRVPMIPSAYLWVRIVYDATYFKIYYSPNGVRWIFGTRTAWTSLGSMVPDQIIVGVDTYDGGVADTAPGADAVACLALQSEVES